MSQTYWQGAAADKAMQDEHAFIWKAMLETIDVDLAGKRVLDAGCNRGGFLRLLADRCGIAEGIGYDPASGAIEDARRLVGQRPFQFEAGDTVPAGWGGFDAAFSHEVLYLLHDLPAHARAIFGALVPGGVYYAVMGVHAAQPADGGVASRQRRGAASARAVRHRWGGRRLQGGRVRRSGLPARDSLRADRRPRAPWSGPAARLARLLLRPEAPAPLQPRPLSDRLAGCGGRAAPSWKAPLSCARPKVSEFTASFNLVPSQSRSFPADSSASLDGVKSSASAISAKNRSACELASAENNSSA